MSPTSQEREKPAESQKWEKRLQDDEDRGDLETFLGFLLINENTNRAFSERKAAFFTLRHVCGKCSSSFVVFRCSKKNDLSRTKKFKKKRSFPAWSSRRNDQSHEKTSFSFEFLLDVREIVFGNRKTTNEELHLAEMQLFICGFSISK